MFRSDITDNILINLFFLLRKEEQKKNPETVPTEQKYCDHGETVLTSNENY